MIIKRDLVVNDTVNIQTKNNIVKKIIDFLKGLVNTRTLPYIVMLFLTATVDFIGFRPFAIVMLGVATIFNIPLLVPLIVTIASLLIFKSDSSIIIKYVITYKKVIFP